MDENSGVFRRRKNWYYRDWEKHRRLGPGGTKATDWVYVGDRYDYADNRSRKTVRRTCGICLPLVAATYVLISLCPAYGGRVPIVCYPEFLAAVPVLFFSMGAFWTAYTRESMTYRRYHASVLRLRWSCLLGEILMGLTFLGQIANLILNPSRILPVWDPVYLAGSAVCTACFIAVQVVRKRHPVANVGKAEKA